MSVIAAVEALNFGLDHLAAAARRRGHELVLLTADRSRYLHELAQAEPGTVTVVDVDTDDAGRVLAVLRAMPAVAGVLRMVDSVSDQAVHVARELGLPHADPAAVALLRDKGGFRDHLRRHGLSRARSHVFDPATATTDDLVPFLDFPCVVKDVAGAGSRNVWLVRDKDELTGVLEAARMSTSLGGRDLIAETYLIGPMYSAETLTWDGQTRVLGVCSRTLSPEPHFREESASFPVALPDHLEAEIREHVSRTLASVGYRHGFTHTEFIRTADGVEIVEVNPRLGGVVIGELMRRAAGLDVHQALVEMALGERPALMDLVPPPPTGAAGVALYAPEPGVVASVEGAAALASHPGSPQLYAVQDRGARIATTGDQRGLVSIVLAEGETAELALHHAWSAAGKIRVRMETAGGTP
ncbi:ATP-grasp domain-containing protein [Streptomyces sp. MI02-7b]|uniref:ATP-grasp domain-containing protein n=1 Tax=Streptomyces sp. MI02-7b TaxID=462941 RepID=UPI0029B2982B|nr:ATP-grasp domain-containing protein [Streptomyces sp. MI02-7b]MDX3075448.1 ATP-grasp domain-containing protein [Streptomyces sp. MI02-7b]